ncbi:MAG TPA: hypothetical protein PKH69_12170 [Thiobacillaceae bacterium]|nr:hypothetical protein [Thiobacillaceae bacterium]HNU65267.1 hypothetical protein [Thiobacillaceae bacterium]
MTVSRAPTTLARSFLPLAGISLMILGAVMPVWGQQGVVPQPPANDAAIGAGKGQNPYLIYVPKPPSHVVPGLAGPDMHRTPPVVTPTPDAGKTAPVPSLADLGRSLRGYFTQEELDLLFDYMMESVVASFKGEDVYLPADLSFKLEVLLARMKKEGVYHMDNMMKQLEADLKRSLKDRLVPAPDPKSDALPPTSPASVPGTSPVAPAPGSIKLPAFWHRIRTG